MWDIPAIHFEATTDFQSFKTDLLTKIDESPDSMDESTLPIYYPQVIEALNPQFRTIEALWNLPSIAENITEMWVEQTEDTITRFQNTGGVGLTGRWYIECDPATPTLFYSMHGFSKTFSCLGGGMLNFDEGELLVYPSAIPYDQQINKFETPITVICFNIKYDRPNPMEMVQNATTIPIP